VRVRDYTPEDRKAITAIHKSQGLDYRMIDLTNPWVIVPSVCTTDDGEIIGAVVLKMEPEAYLFLRPDANPQIKWDAIRLMQRHTLPKLIAAKIDQIVAYVPDTVKSFAKRLSQLGWLPQRSGWTPWSYSVSSNTKELK
jgi:hypothetical protein